MTTSDNQSATTLQAAPADPATEPKATTKAHTAPRKPRVTPSKAKSGKKTTPAKKAPKGAKAAKPAKKEAGPCEGSKAEKMLQLLKGPDGATIKELMKATGWQAHSVRGYLSGTIRKKMGLEVISAKAEDGERSYSVKG